MEQTDIDLERGIVNFLFYEAIENLESQKKYNIFIITNNIIFCWTALDTNTLQLGFGLECL